ncbi:MAG: ornithine carbamoyltransferase [Pseudomonadota bacterium]
MKSFLNQRLLSAEGLTPADARSLVDTAVSLRRAAQSGLAQPLLRGKNIAVLCVDPACRAAADFDKAASLLGARVSRVQPDQSLFNGEGSGVRMLARLYDAIECDELPAELVQRLQRQIGVPVYDGLLQPGHPLGALLAQMQGPATPDDALYLAQAVLVQTVG